MPEWSVTIVIALIGMVSGLVPGLAALRNAKAAAHKAETERIQTISQSAEAARVSASQEWQALTASQRETLEEYRCRLVAVTDRVKELEKQLSVARETIQELEDRAQEQDSKIFRLEQERARWETERVALRARIAELEGCKR